MAYPNIQTCTDRLSSIVQQSISFTVHVKMIFLVYRPNPSMRLLAQILSVAQLDGWSVRRQPSSPAKASFTFNHFLYSKFRFVPKYKIQQFYNFVSDRRTLILFLKIARNDQFSMLDNQEGWIILVALL